MNIFFDLENEVLYVNVDCFINIFYYIIKNVLKEKKCFKLYLEIE